MLTITINTGGHEANSISDTENLKMPYTLKLASMSERNVLRINAVVGHIELYTSVCKCRYVVCKQAQLFTYHIIQKIELGGFLSARCAAAVG